VVARTIPLCNLQIGQEGTVVQLMLRGPLRRRLLALGILPGETVGVARVAPLGDPLELVVKGYRLSLRRVQARQILVSPSSEGHSS
jgi:ferrous iron transport protein A